MSDPILDFAWPLELVLDGSGATVPRTVVQDSDDDIKRGLHMACEIRVGDLDWDPTVGTPSPIGSTDAAVDAASIEAALRALDPRAAQVAVDLVPTEDGNDRDIHLKVTT